MEPTLEDAKVKLQAARFFHRQLGSLYRPGMEMSRIGNPLFYTGDALIWELYAAFDLVLQYINAELQFGLTIDAVGWNKNYREKLKASDQQLFMMLSDERNQPWFTNLSHGRHYISHKGRIGLYVDELCGVASVVSIAIPGLLAPEGASIDLLDQTGRWIGHMDALIKSVAERLHVKQGRTRLVADT